MASWLRRYLLREHRREHDDLERRLEREEARLRAQEVRLTRLEIEENLRARRVSDER